MPALGKLQRYVGTSRKRRYLRVTILLYPLALLVVAVLTIDSVETLVENLVEGGRTLEDDDADGGGMVSSAALAGAFLVALGVSALAYVDVAGVRAVGFLKVAVYAAVGVLLWAFAIAVVLGIPGAILYVLGGLVLVVAGVGERGLLVYAGASMELLFAIAFGAAAVVTVGRLNWAFPGEIRDGVADANAQVEEATEALDRATEEIDAGSYATAAESLAAASVSVAIDAIPSTSAQRVEAVRTERRALAERLVTDAVSDAKTEVANGHYRTADGRLRAADDVATAFDIEHAELDSVRADVDAGLSDAADEKADTVRSLLREADAAREAGDFGRAGERLRAAAAALESLEDIAAEADSSGLSTRLTQARRAVERDKTAAKIDEYRASIADALGCAPSRIVLEEAADSVEPYAALERVVDSLGAARAEYPSLPWEELETALVSELPGLPTDRIDDYDEIVSNATTVRSFLDTVPESHPSVRGDEWREAVDTALEEGYLEVLNPAIAHVERLRTGLWKPDHLHVVSWQEFERLIGLLYRERGYAVEVTQGSADLGVDVWAERDGERLAVQVKQYSDGNTVGRETLQKLSSTLAKGDADRAVVVTSGEFARTAEQYAADFGPNLELVDGTDLVTELSESNVPPPV